MTAETSTSRIAGYVLAGGGSTRFGRDKALVKLSGKPMLVRMCALLSGIASEPMVVAEPEKYGSLGVKCIADIWPGEGPLGGIVTALEHSEAKEGPPEWNLILSCDMPFLTSEWISFLAARAAASAAQVVLPHSAHAPEPLCACYRTDVAPALRAAFERGVRKVTEALKRVRTEVLDEREWKRFDNGGRLFWNMNTAEDFVEARRILETARAQTKPS